ncbi:MULTISPECIES: UxaA family hydrolase [Pelosinus]|uniref:D-galactarate dehydratase/Altronate hydrolase domain protein n=1 Tax=Pelosinus fermentans B4 TaxID=1149862 RepID=I8RMW5_9FIRM|nr:MULTISPECIES: UxaA family hydrolase [Pelosinus]EIW20275.1 D-galactarate dehydratase/Altronate hydrolase domain protein [Pelosinus fermentans B4]EIW25887.1 D-galactarate dehydratase/Altronate hydrolase domain protein [Pelosinus fermentans A11]OAM93185.1 Altronate dehydratase [Pelosinus fermentans DSM 17108]SDQ69655.1 altronate dehydratase large subunit [Pelosinus fermentans]
MNFWGYKRPDEKVGVRNHVLILPTCACSSETCRMVAMQVKGTINISNQNGCAQVEDDLAITKQVLAGLAANPNVYGTVLIGLGCENAQAKDMGKLIRSKTNKPLKTLIIQEEGGTISTIRKAVEYAQQMVEAASALKKEQFPIAELIVGTNCGGSDPTSGLAANPVVGNLSDQLVDLGSTSILCETTEFIGAEHILAKQADTPQIAQQIYDIIKRYEDHLANVGQSLRNGNPSPGNKEGGITTLEEKSLGCIHKGGHRPIVEVLDYAQCPTKKGLVIMDTPGYDIASVTGVAAGGALVMVFTTGRGTPTGNPIIPVIKITANQSTYEKMKDNMDFDASPVIRSEKSIEEMGAELLKEVLAVANGKVVKAEVLGFNEIAISRLCNYV